MRYIDEMIQGIPLEEMTGGKALPDKRIRVKPVIEDKPTELKAPLPEAVLPENKREINTEPENKPSAYIRSSHFGGVIAAALALVIGVGGTLAYFGIAKHTGPLAGLGSAAAPALSDSEGFAYAKAVFMRFNTNISAIIAEGEINKLYYALGREIKYDLDNINLEPEQKVFETLTAGLDPSDGFPTRGKIIFKISKDTWVLEYVQWKAGDDSVIYQYPESMERKPEVLGEKKKGHTVSELVHYTEDSAQSGEKLPLAEIGEGLNCAYKGMRYEPQFEEKDVSLPYSYEQMLDAEFTFASHPDYPLTYGHYNVIKLNDPDGKRSSIIIRSSDRPDADALINGVYCVCPMANEMLAAVHGSKDKAVMSKFTDFGGQSQKTIVDARRLIEWYSEFLQSRCEPVTELISSGNTQSKRFVCADFIYEGQLISVCTSAYDNANVQINNRFYKVDGNVNKMLSEILDMGI